MSKRLLILMCSIFLIVPLLFMGCGNDGSAGPAGATGATGATGGTGPAGPPGPITNTNESCMVCHTTGRLADISDINPASITHYNANYEKPNITVRNIVVSNVGGLPKVAFQVVKTSDNSAVTTMVSGYPRFMISNLVPATPAAPKNGWSSDLWETWASERSDTVGGVWDTTGSATGNYAYTFLTPFDNAVALSPDIDNTQVQRLIVRVSGGTVVNNAVGTTTNNGIGIADFIGVPAPGANAAILAYKARQFVTADACRKCHGPLFAGAAHGGSYADPQDPTFLCSLCHTPIGGLEGPDMVTSGAWAINFYHKIHSAIAMPAWASRIGGKGYGAVTYPQDVRNCVTCHNAEGNALGLGDKIDNWKTNPNRAACGSCHTSIDFATGTGHGPSGVGGSQATDANCAVCHPASGTGFGKSVTQAHDTTPTGVNVPEFDVTLTLSPVKTFYVAGDNVTVTATLNLHGTSTAVSPSVYTSAKGAAGTAGGGLFSASLYIYGPRALPKPIFAPTDNTQAHNLFVGTVDRSGTVATDNTGFKYRFTVPSGLANGTYMVRSRFGDYGRISDNNYVVESITFQNIQIGNATVTKKVSGDACVDCHGTGSAPFHDARHIVVFNTDECVSCHDYSGGHADVLSNRVHAVHSASKTGDILVIDWSDVTYPLGIGWPGGIGRCDICHSSGNTSYRSVTHESACLGCHGDRTGATDHMLQNGGAFGVSP